MSHLENAPRPAATGRGLKAKFRNDSYLPISLPQVKPLHPKGQLQHIGKVIPGILIKLIIVALASERTRPEVKQYLLEVLS